MDSRAISFHPNKNQVATLLSAGGLAVCDLQGSFIWKTEENFETIFYSKDGQHIWGVAKLSKEWLRIAVIDSVDGEISACIEIEDVLYDSYLSLMDIQHSEAMMLELGAGQDGICVLELCFECGTIHTKEAFPNQSYIMPAITPDGQNLLTLENDERTFAAFSYPELELIAKQSFQENKDDACIPDYEVIYLKKDLAIIQNMGECYFLLDPLAMEVKGELCFKGYPPIYDEQEKLFFSQIHAFKRIGPFLAAQTSDVREPTTFLLNEAELVCFLENN
ncbi:hypothetical protein [Listeria costaricensis]|uniref:hypothetical protein n=1 Tax=Listeria costaricensis TaxID=2026604 RepID=UPI0013C51BC1|nr:hypothetical protein [Listeria costaricensis]